MALHPDTVKELIRLGGNIKVSGNFHPDSLKEFVWLANSHKVHLTIEVNNLHPDTLKELVRLGQSNLTLELL